MSKNNKCFGAEQGWLDAVYRLISEKGPIGLSEVGNICTRPKKVKGKLSSIFARDGRFIIENGNTIMLSTSPSTEEFRKPAAVPSIISGTNWTDVDFNDQTEGERGIFHDMRCTHDFVVRGKSYLIDGVKEHTGPGIFRLVVSEFVEVPDVDGSGRCRYDHIATMGRIKQRLDALRSIPQPPEILLVNYQYSGAPGISQVAIFVTSPDVNSAQSSDSPADAAAKKLWSKFKNSICSSNDEREALFAEKTESSVWDWVWTSDVTWAPSTDEGVYPRKHFTNITFKVIPRISDCSWIVRNAVPSNKPCILGNKVQQKYFKGENYVEIDVDIGSSTVACNVMGVIRSASKHFTGAYALVLQGAAEDELPEKVLACQDGDQPDFEHLKSINSTIVPL